jgi:hypothetical protein
MVVATSDAIPSAVSDAFVAASAADISAPSTGQKRKA